MIARITCSMMSRLTPRAWMRRMRPMISSISVGLSPDITSSSSSSRGSVARPRATSRRLRSGSVRWRAGTSRRGAQADEVHDLGRAPPRRRHVGRAVEGAHHHVLERGEPGEGLHELEGAGEPEPADRVRLEPHQARALEADGALARAGGSRPPRGTPWSCPRRWGRSGPRSRPGATVRSKRLTATRPPNRLVRPRISSPGALIGSSRRGPAARGSTPRARWAGTR